MGVRVIAGSVTQFRLDCANHIGEETDDITMGYMFEALVSLGTDTLISTTDFSG